MGNLTDNNPVRSDMTMSTRMKKDHMVAILLCTYNGQAYLSEQLDSFAAQSHQNWKVWASDDGSNDDTISVLKKYQLIWGSDKLEIIKGPSKGFVVNFLSIACNPKITADFYCFSDQDDVWESEKLERALNWLRRIPGNNLGLYCSRSRLIDENNKEIGYSPIFTKPPSFSNALVQNIGGGNTMVFNNAARRLICEAGNDLTPVTHDWWVYQVVSGCGGNVFHDTYPAIRYRQHAENLIGSNIGWFARTLRLRLLLKGSFKSWNDQNIQALQRIRSKLTPVNQQILDKFSSARRSWILPRIIGIKQCGVYRQTLLGNIGLIMAVLLNKI